MAWGKYDFTASLLFVAVASMLALAHSAEAHDQPQPQSETRTQPQPEAKPQTQTKGESIYCVAAQDPELCESLVKGTKTAMEATAKAIKISILIAKSLEPFVDRFLAALPKDVPPESRESVTNTCQQDYRKVIDNFSEALVDLHKGNKDNMANKLSTPCMTNCVADLDQYNVSAPDVKKAKHELDKYAQTAALVAKNC